MRSSPACKGLPFLFVYDVHVSEQHQKCGLGKHLVTMLELIGRKANVNELVASVPNADQASDGLIPAPLTPSPLANQRPVNQAVS